MDFSSHVKDSELAKVEFLEWIFHTKFILPFLIRWTVGSRLCVMKTLFYFFLSLALYLRHYLGCKIKVNQISIIINAFQNDYNNTNLFNNEIDGKGELCCC